MKQKTELLALIAGAIAGQGNQVDAGGALAEILSELVSDAAPNEVTDITALTGDQLDALEVGAKVIKKTGTAKHLYVVSYKDAENGGLCLTYTDAENVETVAYDHTESGWVFNGITPTHIGG